jgi:ferrochelatase
MSISEPDRSPAGVLLMAHGTPDSTSEMPEYLRLVRSGRLPSPELVEEMTRNYEAIGGRSPLTAITLAQADALRARLRGRAAVAVGMRNWKPFIKSAVEELRAAGATRIIGVPLTPQFSVLSVGKYYDAAQNAIAGGARLERIESFYQHPLLAEAFAERLREAAPRGDEEVVFTAHSLPKSVVERGDPYVKEVEATARAVADRAGVRLYRLAYQSAGRTPEPWIGPDLGDLVRERAAAGVRAFVVAPIGFVCDHTEILFDIDVQARAAAEAAGASLRRINSLNTSPTFISMLEDVVERRLAQPDP